MDILSLIGLIIGFGAISGSLALGGGQVESLINAPAALIVIGGTIGAVLTQTPVSVLVTSLRMGTWVFFPKKSQGERTIERILEWSNIARKEGLLGLEDIAENESDPFAQKGLQLLVDGSEPEVIRRVMEVDLSVKADTAQQAARVYEAMARYAPRLGVAGAVIGLIGVLQYLGDPSKLASGFAIALVALIYGVGLANIVFLPIANKLQAQVRAQTQLREMVVEGVISIAEGENPRNIETKLQGFVS